MRREMLRMAKGWKQQLTDRQAASSHGHVCQEGPPLPTGSALWKSHPEPKSRVEDLPEACATSETQAACRGGGPRPGKWGGGVRGTLGLSLGLAAVSPWDLVTQPRPVG